MYSPSLKWRAVAVALAVALTSVNGFWPGPAEGAADNAKAAFLGEMYVFGDSLSDSGNAFALTGGALPPNPPYAGRFSNGPVWTEQLAEILHLDVDLEETLFDDPLANNQAVGGAFTDYRNYNGPLDGTGILGQVSQFAANGGSFRRRDVILLWGGANNYIFDPNPDPAVVVGNLVEAVEELADLGGKRFVVPNLPDLGRTPLARITGTSDPLTAVTDLHNAALKAAMSKFGRNRRLKILVLDIRSAFDELLDSPAILPNKLLPCIDNVLSPTGACAGLPTAFTEDQTVFWDPLHPTTATHGILAMFAAGAITARPTFKRRSVFAGGQ